MQVVSVFPDIAGKKRRPRARMQGGLGVSRRLNLQAFILPGDQPGPARPKLTHGSGGELLFKLGLRAEAFGDG